MLPRVLVLLLLTMNIGVAVWWALRPPPSAAVAPVLFEPGVGQLQLLSEVEPRPAVEDVPALESMDAPVGLAQRECLQIGPFLTQIDLRRAMNAVAPLASRIQFRETREVIRRGFRVYLPSPGTREAALDTARQLSRRGVSDYYVVTAGNEQNTISLGLFRDRGNAESRRDEVIGLGFAAEISARDEELPQFWIDVDLPVGLDWREQLGGYAGVDSRTIPCDGDPGE